MNDVLLFKRQRPQKPWRRPPGHWKILKIGILLYFFTSCLMLLLLPSDVPAQSADEFQFPSPQLSTARVLILHSYHYGFTWTDNISKGIRSVFAEYEGKIELHFEFMDTRRLYTQEYFHELQRLFHLKYARQKIDVIICSDDHAFNFVMGLGQNIFSNVPVVFLSVTGYKPSLRRDRQLTGLEEAIDIKGTLDVALQLHPKTREVAVITDMTRTGQALKAAAEKIFQDYEPHVRFRYLEDLTVEELTQKVSEFPDDTIVFLFIFSKDKAGRVFSHEQNLKILARHCNVPIYSVWKFYLGHGITGGKLVSGEAEGTLAARMALRILSGENASDIPPRKSPIQYMFDYVQLKRFHIKLSSLPKDSIVINKPFSIYEQYKSLIWGGIATIVLLLVIVAILFKDIMLRRRVEKALRESEARVRGILSSLHETIIMIFDRDGKLRFVWGDPELDKRYGVRGADLIGKSFQDGHPSKNAQEGFAKFQQVFERGKAFRDEIVVPFPTGDFWHDVSLSPMKNSAGEVTAVVAFVRDITQLKQLEQDLQNERASLAQKVEERTSELSKANAELARASRLKDEFLANMSHELRTPLHVILGMSESLQEEVYGSLNEKQRNSLRMIEESGHNLLTLITDVLDLAKIGAGKLELEIDPVQVESICQTALRLIKPIAQKKHLKVTSLFDNTVTMIHADGRRLQQILVNLLSNAVKFTPDGGKIGLEMEGDPEQGVVHFTVWDSGIGIAQDEMEQLFQPFVQLDASLSRKYEGTGLGLSLVYHMVEMHGGSISVESEVGTGSRFIVSLPWQRSGDGEIGSLGDGKIGSVGDGEMGRKGEQKDSSPAPHLAPRISQPAPRRILIADDHEGTIGTLSTYLEAKGYRVTIARNGWEAFALTKEHQPDIIIMDIQMPEMDGLEAIRHIREDKQGYSIPIIALTALAMPGDREKCLEAGANEYLSKPVSLRELGAILEQLLTKEGNM